MNNKLKYYIGLNKVLGKREAIDLLVDISADAFEHKDYSKNKKLIFLGMAISCIFWGASVFSFVYGIMDNKPPFIVVGAISNLLLIVIFFSLLSLYKKSKDEAVAQAYRNAYHIEKVLKLSEVIHDLIPAPVKDLINLNFYTMEEYQKYYESLRNFIIKNKHSLYEIIKTEEKMLKKDKEKRQRLSDLN